MGYSRVLSILHRISAVSPEEVEAWKEIDWSFMYIQDLRTRIEDSGRDMVKEDLPSIDALHELYLLYKTLGLTGEDNVRL